MQKPERAPARLHSYYVIPANHKGKRVRIPFIIIVFFFFFFFSRQWPRLNVPPALEATGLTTELPAVVQVQGKPSRLQGTINYVENN